MTSAATCTLSGRKITVDSYKDATAADIRPTVEASGTAQWWAQGTGWTAFETDDSLIQLQLTNNAAALAEITFSGAQPTADLSGEHTAAKSIAKSLGGHLEHFAG
jgi:hypothetical protein